MSFWDSATSEMFAFRVPDFGLFYDEMRLKIAPDAQANRADKSCNGAVSRSIKDFDETCRLLRHNSDCCTWPSEART
jgi:hypothetical protein